MNYKDLVHQSHFPEGSYSLSIFLIAVGGNCRSSRACGDYVESGEFVSSLERNRAATPIAPYLPQRDAF